MIVGNTPTTDGTFDTIGQGSLQIINRFGHVVQTLSDPNLLDGPWGSTLIDHGSTAQLYVSNVLNGTVTRINLKVVTHHGSTSVNVASMTQIGSGFAWQGNAAAVVVGPTGLAYNAKTTRSTSPRPTITRSSPFLTRATHTPTKARAR